MKLSFINLRLCSVVVLGLVCGVLGAVAQITEPEAMHVALNAAEQSVGPIGKGYERSNERDTDLEQKFSQVVPSNRKPPFIFRFWCESCSEGRFESLVAVSPTGKVYLLRGANALQHFENISKDYGVELSSNDDVEGYLAWYLAADPENRQREKIDSSNEAKTAARQELRRTVCATLGGSFDTWWNKHINEVMTLKFGNTIHRISNGYRVRFYILSGCDNRANATGPAFRRVSIKFLRNGGVIDPRGHASKKKLG